MSFLNSRIKPQLPLTNSIVKPELKTTFHETKPTVLNPDMGKKTARRDFQNSMQHQHSLYSITRVKEYSTDDLTVFVNRKTTPTPKLVSWTTEEKEALPLVRSRNHRGDRVLLLVLCLMCAAALGLSLLMLFGVLRPHCPPDTKIGKNENTRCFCDSFPLYSLKPQISESWRILLISPPVYSEQNDHSTVPKNNLKRDNQPRDVMLFYKFIQRNVITIEGLLARKNEYKSLVG